MKNDLYEYLHSTDEYILCIPIYIHTHTHTSAEADLRNNRADRVHPRRPGRDSRLRLVPPEWDFSSRSALSEVSDEHQIKQTFRKSKLAVDRAQMRQSVDGGVKRMI